VTNIIH